MVLSRVIAVPRDKVDEAYRGLRGDRWPGSQDVPANPNVICRKVRKIGEQDKLVFLEAIYEG